MIDTKSIFRALLINNAPLVALVPAVRITQSWPGVDQVFPCIVFSEANNPLDDDDYADDIATSETSEMQVDIFCKPRNSSTPIAQAIDVALAADYWNRDSAIDLVEPDTGMIHKVMRYSKRITY